MVGIDYESLYKKEARRVTRHLPAQLESRPELYKFIAQQVNLLCADLGTPSEKMKPILLLPQETDFKIKPLMEAIKAQPESLFRFALLRDAADAITRKCGNTETARVWWHTTNSGEPFTGQTPMRFIEEGKKSALLQANYTIMAMQ